MLDFYKGKTVLITGHTGFKGSWLCKILIEAGANVIGYSLEPSTSPNLFDICGLKAQMTSVIGDIRDFKQVLDLIDKYRPEIIFHLAAQPIVLIGYKEPLYTYEVNVIGTATLLEAVRQVGCVKSFVNITTDKVYENDGTSCHSFVEDEKLDGYDPYSNSKSCSELVTHCYKKSYFSGETACAISTARAGNVIGGGDFSPDRIIPDCVRAVEKGNPIRVRNRFSTRPYQFVLEPLFVYLLIAQKQYEDKRFSGCYNVGPDSIDAINTGDLVDLFCQKWGGGARWVDQTVLGAPHEATYLSLDNSLLKKTFGWRPVYHVDRAMDEIVAWTKALNGGGSESATEIMKNQILGFYESFTKVIHV